MRIYKYSMRFRVPALDQLDHSICYNYDLRVVKVYRAKFEVRNIRTYVRLVAVSS